MSIDENNAASEVATEQAPVTVTPPAAQQRLTPSQIKMLMNTLGRKRSKRGVTKAPYRKAKARAYVKMQRASRKANRNTNQGKRATR